MVGKYYHDYYKIAHNNLVCYTSRHVLPYLQFVEGWSGLILTVISGGQNV